MSGFEAQADGLKHICSLSFSKNTAQINSRANPFPGTFIYAETGAQMLGQFLCAQLVVSETSSQGLPWLYPKINSKYFSLPCAQAIIVSPPEKPSDSVLGGF